MKLVTFTHQEEKSIGVVEGDQVIDLSGALLAYFERAHEERAAQITEAYIPKNMVDFLAGGQTSFTYAKKALQYALNNQSDKYVFRLDSVKLEAPVQQPQKIICVGHNYREHILEMGREIPPHPVVFAKFSNTIIGPEDDIPFYPISEQLDYEAEFTFVIGKRAKNVSEEEALDFVAGYTICNDVTYRDIQRRTLQWLQGKSVDGSAPMGPWLITTDELPNPAGLDISLYVNGEKRQQSNTANLVFSVQHLVAFLSRLMTLEPGDVIMTGTPGGVGVAMEPPTFLQDGDVVRIEVEQVGVLENKVVKVSE